MTYFSPMMNKSPLHWMATIFRSHSIASLHYFLASLQFSLHNSKPLTMINHSSWKSAIWFNDPFLWHITFDVNSPKRPDFRINDSESMPFCFVKPQVIIDFFKGSYWCIWLHFSDGNCWAKIILGRLLHRLRCCWWSCCNFCWCSGRWWRGRRNQFGNRFWSRAFKTKIRITAPFC